VAHPLARAHCVFHGKVQGVFFRANCEADARRRGLRGWVRNLPDGTVEAVFEGPRDEVEKAIRWNRVSQPHARVSEIDVEWEAATGEFAGFDVR
jgi:acylphosphatase